VKKVLLQHSNGKRRYGFIVSQHGNVVRVRWSEKSSEGVDINLATKKSPLNGWTLVREVGQRKKTKVILGHKLTLVSGHRYLATRPMLEGEIDDDDVSVKLPVTITDLNNPNGDPVALVGDLSYEDANSFLNAFNSGEASFEGRVW
jgi:hypothetical protein